MIRSISKRAVGDRFCFVDVEVRVGSCGGALEVDRGPDARGTGRGFERGRGFRSDWVFLKGRGGGA